VIQNGCEGICEGDIFRANVVEILCKILLGSILSGNGPKLVLGTLRYKLKFNIMIRVLDELDVVLESMI